MFRALSLIVAILVSTAAIPACDDGAGEGEDAGTEPVCVPGRLRCDPGGSQALQRCDEDGMGWSDYLQCDLCHDAECFGHLDASSG